MPCIMDEYVKVLWHGMAWHGAFARHRGRLMIHDEEI